MGGGLADYCGAMCDEIDRKAFVSFERAVRCSNIFWPISRYMIHVSASAMQ